MLTPIAASDSPFSAINARAVSAVALACRCDRMRHRKRRPSEETIFFVTRAENTGIWRRGRLYPTVGTPEDCPRVAHPSKNGIFMAKNNATKKSSSPKAAAKPAAAAKPVKEALSKSGLVAHLAEASGVIAKDVRAVLAALEGAVHGSVSKKGVGSFTLPGLLKITALKVPAKPKRKGINPFTKEEQWFAAKPASVKVKVRPLKKLKDAAA